MFFDHILPSEQKHPDIIIDDVYLLTRLQSYLNQAILIRAALVVWAMFFGTLIRRRSDGSDVIVPDVRMILLLPAEAAQARITYREYD